MMGGMEESYLCPACEQPLDFEPWPNGLASFEICPHCGIQFGYTDAGDDEKWRQLFYAEWRERWIAAGRPEKWSGLD